MKKKKRAPRRVRKNHYWLLKPVVVNGLPRWCLESLKKRVDGTLYCAEVIGNYASQVEARKAIKHLEQRAVEFMTSVRLYESQHF